MPHGPDDPRADLSVHDVGSTAKLLVAFTEIRSRNFLPGKFEFSENRRGEKKIWVFFTEVINKILSFDTDTCIVRVIQNFIQDRFRKTYAVTFGDNWCNERHAVLKGVN